MKTIFKIFVTIVVFAATTAVKEGDEGLMKILAKERKEMREIFQRENDRLAQQAEENAKQNQLQQQKLQRQNDQLLQRLEKQDEKLQQQVTKQAEEITKQNQVQQQQQQVIAKLHDQNRKLHQKLRRSELETKSAFRQKDQKDNLNMKKMIHSEMQQSYIQAGRNNTNDTLVLEMKKLIKKEINNFLKTKKVCVGGQFRTNNDGNSIRKTVNFEYTFPRKPTVVASVAFRYYKGDYCGAFVREVTKSSTVIETYSQDMVHTTWMACL